MNANEVIPEEWKFVVACQLWENRYFKRWGQPLTVEHLEGCDWSHSVNFSMITHNNQIFSNDFVCIHYDLYEISSQIIVCKNFDPHDLS